MRGFALEHRISHADVDLLGELKVQALLGLLEQAAVEASADAGFDPASYSAAGRMWIIRRTRLERLLPVGGGDTVSVQTQVEDWRRARSLRGYEVRLVAPGRGIRGDHVPSPEPGGVVARATTDWVYCDIATGRPVSVPDHMRRALSGDGFGETLPRARALPGAGDGPPAEMHLTVRASQLDHVTHVNNAAYASYLEDGAFEVFGRSGLSVPRMLELGGALRMRSLDVEYLVDAVAGDDLTVRSWLLPPDGIEASNCTPPRTAHLLQAIDRSDGRKLVRAASQWQWRRRPAILGGVPGL